MIDVAALIGKKVTIESWVGGYLVESSVFYGDCISLVESQPVRICRNVYKINTWGAVNNNSVLVIEDAPVANNIANTNTRYIAFRIDGTSRYLTINPYGNAAKVHAIEVLSSCNLPLLQTDLYQNFVDYHIDNATADSAPEGEGYNYASMTAQDSDSPTISQSFCIEGNDFNAVGFKSYFGNYWCSQHWTRTISQAPHMRRDETWRLRVKE